MTKRPLLNEGRIAPVTGAETETDRLANAMSYLRAVEQEAAERHNWLEAMINHIPDYIYAKDADGHFLFVNEAVVRDNGFDHASELIGKTDFDLHSFDAATSIAEVERRVMTSGLADLGIEERALRGGDERWLMMSRVPLRNGKGESIGVVGMSRDITARKAAEHLLQTQARLLELVAKGMPLDRLLEELVLMIEARMGDTRAAVMVMTDDGRQLSLGAAPSLPAEYCQLVNLIEVSHDSGISGIAAFSGEPQSALDLMDAPPSEHCLRMARRLGLRLCRSMPIRSQGKVLGTLDLYSERPGAPDPRHNDLIGLAADLAGIAIERSRAEARISFLARHDALTGLPNRLHLDAEFENLLASAEKAGRDVAVAFVDLDNFKLVNDSLGHAAGDDLLKITAARMRECVEDGGMVARVGGDEFIIALPIARGADSSLSEKFEHVRRRIAEPMLLEGLHFHVTSSIGVACYPVHGMSVAQLLLNADAAMYRAKEVGRDNLQIFSTEMAETAHEKLKLTEQMRQGLGKDEFVLHFQPQWNQQSGAVSGVEALIRWQHPQLGLVFPSDFIPLAEETGLIANIGDWVLNEACRQAKTWQEQGLPPLVMSVNVSARQFRERAWVSQVADALATSGLDPQYLELEVTESLIMQDMNGAIDRMRKLTGLGVKLAIDDFGTGYSSLSALNSFPVSRLKIDRSFVADIPEDAGNMAITAAIVSLAQKLGLNVIAEGVETATQAAFLLQCGCEDMQGYYFSRPIDAEQCEALLRSAPLLGRQ